MKLGRAHFIIIFLALVGTATCAGLIIQGITSSGGSDISHEYGGFIGYEGKLEELAAYETIVIDVQYYDSDEIAAFKEKGHTIYSYINIGALENFRDYYDSYKNLALGEYEHWDEEIWMDVSDPAWRYFIIEELAPELVDKGIDGFFVDNCDVYYQYPQEDILNGVADILSGLKDMCDTVIMNGGDVFIDAYCGRGGNWKDLISGINQETVFTKIIWDEERFTGASEEDKSYFCAYLDRYGSQGADIFLLEYTDDAKLAQEIREFCLAGKYHCFISDSLELEQTEGM